MKINIYQPHFQISFMDGVAGTSFLEVEKLSTNYQ